MNTRNMIASAVMSGDVFEALRATGLRPEHITDDTTARALWGALLAWEGETYSFVGEADAERYGLLAEHMAAQDPLLVAHDMAMQLVGYVGEAVLVAPSTAAMGARMILRAAAEAERAAQLEALRGEFRALDVADAAALRRAAELQAEAGELAAGKRSTGALLRGFDAAGDDLDEWLDRPAVSIGALPDDHGLGRKLDEAIGGGLVPGDLVLIGASKAAGGKTLLTMQLADGLALAAAEAARNGMGMITPVAVVSEMPRLELRARTLARLLRVSPRRDQLRANRDRAKALMNEEGGLYADLRAWRRYARAEGAGRKILDVVEADVERWAADLRRAHPGREVVPVVVLDSLHRLMDSGLDEVAALNDIAEEVDVRAERHGWIVLATSDTTKPPAADEKKASNALSPTVFRGSYKLMHAADVAMVLALRGDGDDPNPRVRLVKNRRGPEGVELVLRWNETTDLRLRAATGLLDADPAPQDDQEDTADPYAWMRTRV